MRLPRLLLLLASLVFLGSCVTNKKYVLLQKHDVNVKDLPKDSVVRTYESEPFEYQIQPNDLISVRFESLTPDTYNFFSNGNRAQNMNLNNGGGLLLGELVDENGEIGFPVVGKVKVAGFTVFEIQDQLQKLADQYLESPVVKVRLLNFRFTILGEVNNEGTVNLTNNRVNIIEAIGQAGGLTDMADKANIKLIRQRDGKSEIAYINLLDERFLESPYYYVYQNDVLIVPGLRQRPFRRYFGPNLSLVISSLSLLLFVINLTRN